jgi:hypothetical protein
VLVGGTELVPGATIQHITYTKGLTFTIDFTNDGANDEFNVETRLVLSSASTTPLTANAAVRETQPGQPYTATLGFNQTPPLNTTLKLTATVLPVPGEKDVTNNTTSYYVEFNK